MYIRWTSEIKGVQGRRVGLTRRLGADDSRLKFMEDQMGTLQNTLSELVRMQRGAQQPKSE